MRTVETPAPLHYANHPLRWFQRRRLQRWIWRAVAIVLAPVVSVAGVAAARWGRDAWVAHKNQVALAACEAYVPPLGQTVFEMQGQRITTLVTAPPWVNWWTPSKDYPTVFLHRLKDREPGKVFASTQLDVVEIDPRLLYSYDGRTILNRRLICFAPRQSATPWNRGSGPGPGTVFGSTHLVVLPQDVDTIKVYAARVAADDPTAFAFDVEYNAQRQTVRGYLKRNLVILEPQAGQTFTGAGWTPCLFWSPAGATPDQEKRTREAAASTGQPGVTVWPLPSWWAAPAMNTTQPSPG